MDFNKILMLIKPSKKEEEKMNKLADSIISKIKIKDTKVTLGGSGAKNTWLRGNHDIDIYVKFDCGKFKDKSDELSDILNNSLKKSFKKVERLHGSRDYFHVKLKDYTVEIIPILNIKKEDDARNITDFSHLHVSYVRNHSKLCDGVRLAKAFAMANEVYGAESYIRGFSGYVIELLVIHYKSFMNLIKSASKWKDKEIIGNKNLAERLNPSKVQSPLILLDPVQPDRNASAALSHEKYFKFIEACKNFLKKPSEEFFKERKINLNELKKKGKLIILKVNPIKNKLDVQGAKALKAFEHIKNELMRNEFRLIDSIFKFDENVSYFYYILDRKELNNLKKHYGPPVDNEKALEIFKNKYKNVVIDGNKSYTFIKREFTYPLKFTNNLIKDKYFRDKVKSINILK